MTTSTNFIKINNKYFNIEEIRSISPSGYKDGSSTIHFKNLDNGIDVMLAPSEVVKLIKDSEP